jgi:hypothetical protein
MKTFTSFLKIIAIAAVIGVSAFAPAKVYAQQSVEGTIWAGEMMDDDSQNYRLLQGMVSFSIYEFKASGVFVSGQIFWGLTNQARNTLSQLGVGHNKYGVLGEGTYTQSGNTITLNYKGKVFTRTIDSNGRIIVGDEVFIKVPSLNVVEWPDSLKN